MVSTPATRSEFAKLAGEMAESIGFNKSIGQIYGLLYMTGRPLSLDDIAQELTMSKGNASINIRVLEDWGAVHKVSVSGSRRDHYHANMNLKQVALRRIQEGAGKRLDRAEAALERLLASPVSRESQDERKRLHEIQQLLGSVRKAFKALPTLGRFFT